MRPGGATAYIQCGIASAVFAALLLAQLFSYLLYLYPSVEIFWFLSLTFNREVFPVLDSLFGAMPIGPIETGAILAAITAVPAIALWKRNWLGIAASGHAALLVALVPACVMLKSSGISIHTANLSTVFSGGSSQASVGFWLAVAIVLLPLCILNHVAFFRDVPAGKSQH